jgi:signal transduction histidine kinase
MVPRVPDLEWLRLLQHLEQGVLVLAEGRVEGANPALVQMSGQRFEDLHGRPFAELFCDPDGLPLTRVGDSAPARLRDHRGDLVPVTLRAVNERVVLVTDRSRERRLEEEVWRLAGAERPAAVAGPPGGEIAAMIEHDMGTATTVVRGYLRMLLEERAGELTEEQRHFLLEARRETDKIGQLVANLLELASSDRPAALRIARKPARLKALISAVVDGCRPLFDERRQQLELELDVERDELHVDPLRIEQVLTNLLSNATKFAPTEGVVRVAVHEFEDESGRQLCVSVIDDGPGVDPEEIERIFEPFVRGSAAGEASGVGLGLAVCRAIAEAHGGRIEAVPDQGCGHFRLILPVEA